VTYLGKPSIFSREYEKKMKRRKRNAIIFSLTIVVVMSSLIIKVVCNPIDYTNIKENIQAWIDSDNTNSSKQTEIVSEQTEASNEENPVKEESEQSIDIPLASGNIAKAIYVEDNQGGKMFKTLNATDTGISFSISPSNKQMIVTDTNSVITLYNVDGTSKIVSKDEYVSSSGGVFKKEAAIKAHPNYLWNSNPKFISDDKIIFVSNRPYFGSAALKQYLWMTDINDNQDKVFWDLAGTNIEIGEKEEKGIKVTIDGKIYFIDINGNYAQ
jgi:hypothetical protein